MTQKLAFIVSILLSVIFYGQQTKEKLQQQNAALKKQIAAINGELAKTQKESKLSLAHLNNVNTKIQLREKVYNNTQKEKRLIEDEIYLRQLEINRQNRELAVLRKNYADVLVQAYKNKGVQNKVTFILSSRNLGEAIRRVQYIKQYSDYQERKATEISEAANKLKLAVASKQKSVSEKAVLLANQEKDLNTINAERKQKELLLAEFKKNEAKLTAELKQKQAESKKLEGQIRSIIAEEIKLAKAKEEAEKKAEAEKIRLAKIAAEKEKAKIEAENKAREEALERERKIAEAEAKKASDLATKKAAEEKKRTEDAAKAEATAKEEARRIAAAKEAEEAANKAKEAEKRAADARAAEAALAKKKEDEKKAAETKALNNYGVSTTPAASFAASKGNIGMPVRGNITHYFGRQQHPVFKTIWEENNGIKIAVAKGTIAKCVFPGTVAKVVASGDGTKTVLVKHGNYFTVYSNLSNTMVSANQSVSAGTNIGTVGEDFDGSTTLDFQVWNGSTPVNPLEWVN
ncbi:MAG: peptidoglycan DD-metalloendopeptidase family protein [Bergeyella sp.]